MACLVTDSRVIIKVQCLVRVLPIYPDVGFSTFYHPGRQFVLQSDYGRGR